MRNSGKTEVDRNRAGFSQTITGKRHRPLWVPGISYYFLSIALALVIFFLLWASLMESGEPAPFIPAGIGASVFLIIAFVVREVLIRRARMKRLSAQRQLDLNLDSIITSTVNGRQKLSIKQNQKLLTRIFEKSGAARVLKSVPEAHWEVFELCDEYLAKTQKEISRTHVNSPRFRPINKGRGRVKRLHRYHLLKWAKERAGMLSLDASSAEISYQTRLANAETARDCIGTALEYYPRVKELQESYEAIGEYLSTIKISRKMEEAEAEVSIGNDEIALELFEDALALLENERLRPREKDLVKEKILSELRKIRNN